MPATTGYSIGSYGDMVADARRMDAYADALRRAVTPGCTVLDIGAGTGIASLLACQYGAGHVYAIEPDDSIEVARESARRNGYADRITFLKAVSFDVTLPEPVDVLVSDLRGVLPLMQHHIPSIRDARRRLLKPGGVQIPMADRLFAVPVENAAAYRRCMEPWRVNSYGLDLSAGHGLVVNHWSRATMKPEHLLAAPGEWAHLDYTTVENTNVTGSLRWQADRAGTVHGWLLWFDTELMPGIGYSNSPSLPPLVYGQGFFPLEEPVDVTPGDDLGLELAVNLVGAEYVWRWNSEIVTQAGGSRSRFAQSTFHGTQLLPSRLVKREANHVPVLDARAMHDMAALQALGEGGSLAMAAARLQAQFPQRFADMGTALTFVADLSARYEAAG